MHNTLQQNRLTSCAGWFESKQASKQALWDVPKVVEEHDCWDYLGLGYGNLSRCKISLELECHFYLAWEPFPRCTGVGSQNVHKYSNCQRWTCSKLLPCLKVQGSKKKWKLSLSGGVGSFAKSLRARTGPEAKWFRIRRAAGRWAEWAQLKCYMQAMESRVPPCMHATGLAKLALTRSLVLRVSRFPCLPHDHRLGLRG